LNRIYGVLSKGVDKIAVYNYHDDSKDQRSICCGSGQWQAISVQIFKDNVGLHYVPLETVLRKL